jgi:probable rRNA maturation factor
LAARLEERTPGVSWRRLSLVLTGDEEIRALNHRWFGKDRVTDVISFRHPAFPGEETGDEGELVVNLEQALHEGNLRDGPDRELALYLAHGCDHLSGAEDNTPARKRAMLRRERAWVSRAESENLVGGLFPAPATAKETS